MPNLKLTLLTLSLTLAALVMLTRPTQPAQAQTTPMCYDTSPAKPCQPVSAEERAALVAFYNSTNGPNWGSSNKWLVGDPCLNDWYWVSCQQYSTKPSTITELDFWGNDISGTIPSELGNLTSLTRLVLAYNNLSGPIPSTLGNLSKLTHLSLGNNNLSGSIPSELGNLINLTYLDLSGISGNQLTGSIPPELGNLTNLETLNLGHNQLSGSIPTSFMQLNKLIDWNDFFYLSNCLTQPTDPTMVEWLTQFKISTGSSWWQSQHSNCSDQTALVNDTIESYNATTHVMTGTKQFNFTFSQGRDRTFECSNVTEYLTYKATGGTCSLANNLLHCVGDIKAVDLACRYAVTLPPDTQGYIYRTTGGTLYDETADWTVNLSYPPTLTYIRASLSPVSNTVGHLSWSKKQVKELLPRVTFDTAMSNPTVEATGCIEGKYFFKDVAVQNRYNATVDWHKATADQVEFNLNGLPTRKSGLTNPIFMDYDMGSQLQYDPLGAANTLTIQAIGKNNKLSAPVTFDLVGLTPPLWWLNPTAEMTGNCATGSKATVTYKGGGVFPAEPALPVGFVISLPSKARCVGGKEFGLTPSKVVYTMEANPTGTGTFKADNQIGLALGKFSVNGTLKGASALKIAQGQGIELVNLPLAWELEGEIPIFDCKVSDLAMPTQKIPLPQNLLKWLIQNAQVKAVAAIKLHGTTPINATATKIDWAGSSTIGIGTRIEGSVNVEALNGAVEIAASIYGTQDATMQVPENPTYLKEVTLGIGAKGQIYLLGFSCEGHIDYKWTYSTQIENELKPDGSCSYTLKIKTPETRATADGMVAQNVMPDSRPVLATADKQAMVLWADSDSSKAAMQDREIYYTAYNGTAWATAAKLTTDSHQDFNPQVAYDSNNHAVAVWQRHKAELPTTTELDAAYTNGFELAYSVYNGLQWSSPTLLTDNAAFDYGHELVRGNDGQLLLIWRQNEQGQIMGDTAAPDKLLYAVWNGSSWSAPQTLLDNVTTVLNLSAARHNSTTMAVVYSQDMDGDLTTDSDQELMQLTWNGTVWSSPTRLTTDQQTDDQPTLFYDATGQLNLWWLKANSLYSLLGNAAPQIALANEPLTDYDIVPQAKGATYLIWSDNATGQTDLFSATYDSSQKLFSHKMALTNDPLLERTIAPGVNSAGELVIAYNRSELITETVTISPDLVLNNMPTLGQTDMYVFMGKANSARNYLPVIRRNAK